MNQQSNKIYWVAGILEGEATFCLQKGKYPRIALRMCDLDIVQRIRDIISPSSNIQMIDKESENHRDSYILKINGQKAAEWMMTIYPLMGNRRKEKIREILQIWKTTEMTYSREKNAGVIKSIMVSKNVSREVAKKILEGCLNPTIQTMQEDDNEPTIQ